MSQIAVAFGVALAANYVLIFLFPARLFTRTPIVGYPIFANFNINLLFWQMYVPMLFLPSASLFFYLWWFENKKEHVPIAYAPGASAVRVLVGRLGRRFVLGGTLALGLAASRGAGYLAAFSLGGLTYALGREWLQSVARRLAWPGLDGLLCLFCFFVIAAFSHVTGLTGPNGRFTPIPWFPFPLAFAFFTLSLIGLAACRPWRHPLHLLKLDSVLAPLITGATLVFLWWSVLPGPVLISDDFFHGGESLVSAKLMLAGWFPWRDLLFIHGLLEDPFKTMLGFLVFEPSEWGGGTGLSLYLQPLYFSFYFLLYFSLFRRSPAYLLLVVFLLPLCGDPFYVGYSWQLRFLLYPLILLTLERLLARGGFWLAAVFSTLLFWQVLLSPESTYLLPALGIIVFFFEFSRRKSCPSLRQTYIRTLSSLGWGATWGVLLVLFLYRHQALVHFIDYYRIFAEGHRFAGGIPIFHFNWPEVKFWAYMPTAAIICLAWYLVFKKRGSRRLLPVDWTMGGVALFVILYYQKFLSRADNHVLQPYAVGLPLYFYLLFRALEAVESRLGRWLNRSSLNPLPWVRHPFTLSTAVILALTHMGKISSTFTDLATKFQVGDPTATFETTQPRVILSSGIQQMLRDYRVFFERYLQPTDALFDFTNQPYLFFYLLDRQPSTRYFHVSMAITPMAQRDLIAQLERERPKLVAMEALYGLGVWDDISNLVRHYDVSRYLLTHYVPFQEVHGTMFFKRKDLSWMSSMPTPRLGIWECDWGTIPFFWREKRNVLNGVSLPFQTARVGDHYLTQVQVPDGAVPHMGRLEIVLNHPRQDVFQMAFSPEATAIESQRISFRTVKSGEDKTVYPVPVGSCTQWYSNHGNRLYLRYQQPDSISEIRIAEWEF